MFTPEDLKKNKKDVMEEILKAEGRKGIISFCSGILDKRAYFTMDMYGNIKRKKYNHAVSCAVFMEDDREFLDYISENLDFAEKTKIEKISRMNNVEDIEKNIFKLIVKGDFHFALKYCKELCMRNSEEFFKMMFHLSLMDNISFEKPLAVYSLKKYFEKFGYSDEALYLTVSYLAKMRGDFSDFENSMENTEEISKNELKERIKNNIEKYKNEKGLAVLGYLFVLLSYEYEKENIFSNILKKKIEEFEKNSAERDEKLSKAMEDIYKYFSKEV